MARHEQRHVVGWPAFLLAPIAIPIALLAELAGRVGLIRRTADLTADDVESYLIDFAEGRSGDWDWDDFTGIPITAPALEKIRREAAALDLPFSEQEHMRLRELIEEVRLLKR
ncbi:MAG TPA: hypothetical protein VGE65_08710 [Sphingobium sp.]